MTVTKKQAEYLVSEGWEVTLVSNDEIVDWKGVESISVRTMDSWYWDFINYIFVGLTRHFPQKLSKKFDMYRVIPQMRFSKSAVKAISQRLDLNSVSLCICCQHNSAFGLDWFRARSGVPFILLTHGDIFEHPADAFSIPMKLMYKRAAIFAYRTANHIVAVSRSLAGRAISCGASPDKVTVIHHGVDCPDDGRVNIRNCEAGSELKLLFVGRLAPEKGILILIEAIALLKYENLSLKIVGHGPMFESVTKKIRKLEIENKVELVGYVPHESLFCYYENSDLLVLPSLSEAFGLVILEAQAYGLPVVASRIGGIPELVQDGRNGVLIKPGDTESLARALKGLIDNRNLISSMGINALENAKRFSWQTSLAKFGEVVNYYENMGEKR